MTLSNDEMQAPSEFALESARVRESPPKVTSELAQDELEPEKPKELLEKEEKVIQIDQLNGPEQNPHK